MVTSLVGCRYVFGGLSNTGFDCWGLVWYFFNELGVITPKPTEYITRKTNRTKNQQGEKLIRENLKLTADPKEVCVALFKRGKFTIHIGVYFPNERKVLHAIESLGVVFEDLKTAENLRGIKSTFYTWH